MGRRSPAVLTLVGSSNLWLSIPTVIRSDTIQVQRSPDTVLVADVVPCFFEGTAPKDAVVNHF